MAPQKFAFVSTTEYANGNEPFNVSVFKKVEHSEISLLPKTQSFDLHNTILSLTNRAKLLFNNASTLSFIGFGHKSATIAWIARSIFPSLSLRIYDTTPYKVGTSWFDVEISDELQFHDQDFLCCAFMPKELCLSPNNINALRSSGYEAILVDEFFSGS